MTTHRRRAELEVALAGEKRFTLRSVQKKSEAGPIPLAKESVVVVSGGARGVTAATVIALAKATQAQFVLLGRTPLDAEPACCQGATTDPELKRALLMDAKATGTAVSPAALGKTVKRILANREIRQTLTSIEAVGGRATYASCDITDAEGLSRVLDTARTKGPIHGFIHGAGVLADKLIADKSQEQFDFVYDTKLNGLRALLDATENDDLRIVTMFSSVAGRCGNQGQCDYAMANEVLNKVTHLLRKQHPNIIAKSMGWGPWEGGMVTPALKKHFESLGVPLIPLQVGARMLVDELGDRSGDDELVLGGEPRPEPLAAAAGPRSATLAVKVDSTNHGWLADHAIAGKAVVAGRPRHGMVRAHRTCHASRSRDRIHRGRESDAGHQNRRPGPRGVAEQHHNPARERGRRHLVCRAREPEGHKHYSATVRMVERRTRVGRALPQVGLDAFEHTIYDGDVLFHAPRFK